MDTALKTVFLTIILLLESLRRDLFCEIDKGSRMALVVAL
jgi:hypothetical protein